MTRPGKQRNVVIRCMQGSIYAGTVAGRHTHTYSAPRWQNGWAIGIMINIAHIHTLLPLSLPPLCLAHIKAPLFSHHILCLKLTFSFHFFLLSLSTIIHLFSSLLLLMHFSFHFTKIHFPSPTPSPPPFIFSLSHTALLTCVQAPVCNFPSNFWSLFLTLLLFSSRIAAAFLLWSLTYLFGADIVVFMRAASPTATEGCPLNLALVAALGLVSQTDIRAETNNKTR